MEETPLRRIYRAVDTGDVSAAKQLLKEHDRLRGENLLHEAASKNQIGVAQFLLEYGFDIDKCLMPEESTPLIHAIHNSHVDAVRFLLDRGADPRIGRPLIAATNEEPERVALEMVELLVRHGADVNRSYPWFGDERVRYTPLGWAEETGKEAIAAYLRSLGASPGGPNANAAPPASPDGEVVAHFARDFGPVRPLALVEIVPGEPPVAVRVVPPSPGRDRLTLFTTGTSARPMTVPEGEEAYRFAELFVELPASWPLSADALADPRTGWPVQWLRSVAKYPHREGTWLGGPATIVSNGEPPEPLAPGVPYTAVLLLAERSFEAGDGRTVQLYRMFPLFPEERAVERARGIAALLQAFDRANVPFVVDPNRRNVGIS